MFGKIISLIFRIMIGVFIITLLILIVPRLVTALFSWVRVYPAAQAPEKRVAIVFGAGLWRDGSPTPVLRDRVATAAQLYFDGKVEKLLFSGDNSSRYYDEPGAMRRYAIDLGVPIEAIVLDYAGHRTYDTCYRARAIFGVKEAVLVTQSFHLPRALYTCNALGISAIGVPADLRQYRQGSLVFWNLRETLATLVALVDVHMTRPTPILGEPEPIFPYEAQ